MGNVRWSLVCTHSFLEEERLLHRRHVGVKGISRPLVKSGLECKFEARMPPCTHVLRYCPRHPLHHILAFVSVRAILNVYTGRSFSVHRAFHGFHGRELPGDSTGRRFRRGQDGHFRLEDPHRGVPGRERHLRVRQEQQDSAPICCCPDRLI